MNLGFDIDGVIADFANVLISLVKEKYNIVFTKEEIYCHDINLVLGLTKRETESLITEAFSQQIDLINGSKSILEKLQEERHKIYLLTARSKHLRKMTENWLKKNGICYTQLIHLDKGEKNQTKLNLDIIVEDCLQEALEWSPKIQNIIVYNHPWNQTRNIKKIIKRVKNWDEIYLEIQKVNQKRSKPTFDFD
jgi:uncharacterized HAD superfamily protein